MEHRRKIRVYYHDSDGSGIVYYSNYLRYMEVGRTEMMFDTGIDPYEICSNGNYLVISELNIKYKGAAQPGDTVDVSTSVIALRRTAITLRQRIFRSDDMLLDASVKMVYIKDGRPTRLPPEFGKLPFETPPAGHS